MELSSSGLENGHLKQETAQTGSYISWGRPRFRVDLGLGLWPHQGQAGQSALQEARPGSTVQVGKQSHLAWASGMGGLQILAANLRNSVE